MSPTIFLLILFLHSEPGVPLAALDQETGTTKVFTTLLSCLEMGYRQAPLVIEHYGKDAESLSCKATTQAELDAAPSGEDIPKAMLRDVTRQEMDQARAEAKKAGGLYPGRSVPGEKQQTI